MRVAVLEYHDVIDGDDFEVSGFPGASANSYKVAADDFARHLDAVAASGCRVLNDVRQLVQAPPPPSAAVPVLFSFDDGGASSMRSAELLERHGWRGHYFIPSSCVGARGFLSAGELRELAGRGHTVGSHSHSHPLQMGRLSRAAVRDEWARSIAILQDLLGRLPDVASVPGGYYRPFIAESAAACGVRWLFSSEPVVRVERVGEAWVLGRYTLRRGAQPGYVQALTRTPSLARAMQWTTWNMKKAVKYVAGDGYLRVRSALFREAPPQTGDRRPRS